MGLFTYDIKNFGDLFVHGLQDIYYAENQIARALPQMASKATNPALKQAFETHLEETRGQIDRLNQVFSMLGVSASGVDCPAIDGIMKEASDVASEVADKRVLDAALIAAAQAVEHYEIARYGTLIAWSQELGRPECAALLQQTLSEEKSTDTKLSSLAEANVNRKAA